MSRVFLIQDISVEQKLEGEFRYSHSRLITHSEEVAFYGGGSREKKTLNESFLRILRHVYKTLRLRFANGIIDRQAANNSR